MPTNRRKPAPQNMSSWAGVMFLSIFLLLSNILNQEWLFIIFKILPLFNLIFGQWVKNLPTVQETQETWVCSLGQEDLLEEGVVIYSSIFAWRIWWTEEPRGLQSTGSQRDTTEVTEHSIAHCPYPVTEMSLPIQPINFLSPYFAPYLWHLVLLNSFWNSHLFDEVVSLLYS